MFFRFFRNSVGIEFNLARHRKIIKFLDISDKVLIKWAEKKKEILEDKKYLQSYDFWRDEAEKLSFSSYFHFYFRMYADFMQKVVKDLDITEWEVGDLDYCVKKYIKQLSEEQLGDALQVDTKYMTYYENTLESAIDDIIYYSSELRYTEMLGFKRELYSALFKDNKEVLKKLLEEAKKK